MRTLSFETDFIPVGLYVYPGDAKVLLCLRRDTTPLWLLSLMIPLKRRTCARRCLLGLSDVAILCRMTKHVAYADNNRLYDHCDFDCTCVSKIDNLERSEYHHRANRWLFVSWSYVAQFTHRLFQWNWRTVLRILLCRAWNLWCVKFRRLNSPVTIRLHPRPLILSDCKPHTIIKYLN